MTDYSLFVQLRRIIFRVFIIAIILQPVSVQAHMGVVEEIEKVNLQIQKKPNDSALYLLRGNLHRLYGHWQESITDYNQAKLLKPNDSAVDLGIGITYLDQGQFKKSIQMLSPVIKQQPFNIRALVSRAKAFRKDGKPLSSAEDYARVISAFNTQKKPLPEYYFERAKALEAAGANTIVLAIQTLDAGVERLGMLRIFEDYAVELERKRGHYDEALTRLNALISRSVRIESLLLKRGNILLEANRPNAAKADYIAAGEAIDKLPEQRRFSRSMNHLRTKINNRLAPFKQLDNQE